MTEQAVEQLKELLIPHFEWRSSMHDLKGVVTEIKAKIDVFDEKLSNILEQTKKHNGRLTKAEEESRKLEAQHDVFNLKHQIIEEENKKIHKTLEDISKALAENNIKTEKVILKVTLIMSGFMVLISLLSIFKDNIFS